jgi:hypothetical protein
MEILHAVCLLVGIALLAIVMLNAFCHSDADRQASQGEKLENHLQMGLRET